MSENEQKPFHEVVIAIANEEISLCCSDGSTDYGTGETICEMVAVTKVPEANQKDVAEAIVKIAGWVPDDTDLQESVKKALTVLGHAEMMSDAYPDPDSDDDDDDGKDE